MKDMWQLQNLNLPEIVETLTAIVVSPAIVPVADAVKQPIVQTVIKEAIDVWQDISVNLDTAVSNGHREKSSYSNIQIEPAYVSHRKSEIANDVINVISDINADVGSMTNGVADLRLLIPLGLGFFAIRQLLLQRLKLDDIPWYILAWFAFDSFIKLNNSPELATPNVEMN